MTGQPDTSYQRSDMVEALEVSVVLPCLNEAETVGSCVEKALRSLQELGVQGEVVVADNGSTDGSPEIAQAYGARVIDAPVRGYGGALLAGITAARGEKVIMADADDSYDLADLGPFIQALRDGHDMVMGNRFAGGIAAGAMPALHRYLGNPVLSWLGRALFGLKIRDFHCGIRGFHRTLVLALGLCMPGMEFASELVVRAQFAGHDIVEVSTRLFPDGRRTGRRHLRTWRDGWRHLRFLLVLAPRKTLIMPGSLLGVAGLVATALLATGSRQVGNVVFDVSALVYACLALLVGVQLVLLGGVAKVYGSVERLVSPRQCARWVRVLRLEVGAVVGLALVTLGLVGTLAAVSNWKSVGFGPLDARQTIRLVVPSATAIALGVLAASFGLVGSLLTLRGVTPGEAMGLERTRLTGDQLDLRTAAVTGQVGSRSGNSGR